MPGPGGARAQSVQVGAILLFAFLIVALSVTQAYVVPEENGQVEFDHNQRVQSDLVDLRSALLATAATGRPRSTTVQLGTSYPVRAILVNPPPPTGVLRTTDGGVVTVSNATATDDETADYWNGSARSFTTRWLEYDPDYSVYDNAPTTRLEGSVLYNNFSQSNADLVVEPQTLVRGTDVEVTVLLGDHSVGGSRATSVTPRVVSAPRADVTVTRAAAGENVTVSVPTRLDEETWEELLADETAPDGHVVDVRVTGGTLTVELAGERNGAPVAYDLGVSALGVGTGVDETGSRPHYAVTTAGDGTSLLEGTTRNVTVEVRDRYDNPVGAGVAVELAWPDGQVGHVTFPAGPETDADGEVLVAYHAPLNVETSATAQFHVGIDGSERPPGAPGAPANVTAVALTVDDGDEDVVETYGRPLLTAVEPAPNDPTTAFVRVYFPPGVRRGGWGLDDTSGTTASLPEADTAVAYYARDAAAFRSRHSGVNADPNAAVYPLPAGTALDETDDALALVNRSSGRVADEVAYGTAGTAADPRTSNGWRLSVEDTARSVFARVTEDPSAAEPESDAGTYVETNRSSDWAVRGERDFFDGWTGTRGNGTAPDGASGGGPPAQRAMSGPAVPVNSGQVT